MPLYKYQVADGLGTQVYVSPDNALVSVYTTTQSRALAWLGTIPHWLYFTGLRNNQPLWYSLWLPWLLLLTAVQAVPPLLACWLRHEPQWQPRLAGYQAVSLLLLLHCFLLLN